MGAGATDQFGWEPDEEDRIRFPAQETFWEHTKKHLPKRERHRGTQGDWKLNGGLFHRPPEPGVNGSAVTIASHCLQPIFVWAPTIFHRRTCAVACGLQPDAMTGQAPCPLHGFDHSTIHWGWTKPRDVFAETRNFEARATMHKCTQCNKTFAAWNPDSMKWWPISVQQQLKEHVFIGRKSAVARTLKERAVREAKSGMEMGHLASVYNDWQVQHYREKQLRYESEFAYNLAHPTAVNYFQVHGQQGPVGKCPPWPAFQSEEWRGRLLTAAIMRTIVGTVAAARMIRITLKVQGVSGDIWASDDSFKRASRVFGPAVMDHTLGTVSPQAVSR